MKSIDKPVYREELTVTLDPDVPEGFDPDELDADGED